MEPEQDHNIQAVAGFNSLAETYAARFMDLSIYEPGYEAICTLIGKSRASILDIACGPGMISRFLLGRKPEWEVWGIDLAPEMVRLAKGYCPRGNFQVMDCREIDKIDRRFDGLVCGFCLPYLNEPECTGLFRNAYQLLNPGGVFYLSFIEDDPTRSGLRKSSQGLPYHVQYYRSKALTEMGESMAFRLEQQYSLEYRGSDGISEIHTALIFIK